VSSHVEVKRQQTPRSTGAGPRRDPAQLEALVGGVAGPVGPGAAGGAGFVFEGHDGEERQKSFDHVWFGMDGFVDCEWFEVRREGVVQGVVVQRGGRTGKPSPRLGWMWPPPPGPAVSSSSPWPV